MDISAADHHRDQDAVSVAAERVFDPLSDPLRRS
jgi:hypothetical protein